jgi:hypothetical protein
MIVNPREVTRASVENRNTALLRVNSDVNILGREYRILLNVAEAHSGFFPISRSTRSSVSAMSDAISTFNRVRLPGFMVVSLSWPASFLPNL